MEPYDNPFWDFSDSGKKKSKSKKINTKNSGLPKLLRWLHVLRFAQNIFEINMHFCQWRKYSMFGARTLARTYTTDVYTDIILNEEY